MGWGEIQHAPADSPSPRRGHALAYDSARGRVVLFGGRDASDVVYNAETWEWDGTTWSRREPVHAPSPRATHAMAYDAARSRVVLFGGWDHQDRNDETWEWDGTDCSLREPDHRPYPLQYHAMAYDAARGVVLLFGGISTGSGLPQEGDAWAWDGTDWRRLDVDPRPPPRYGHAMAYDEARSKTVLFGGGQVAEPGETWEWDAAGPRPCQRMRVDVEAARRPASAVLEGVTILLRTGASGDSDGLVENGAELWAWWRGGFRVLDAHAAPSESPAGLSFGSRDADEAHGFFYRDSIHVVTCPVGTNGAGYAELATDYAEVVVRYAVPASP